jgi:hypothetical protein
MKIAVFPANKWKLPFSVSSFSVYKNTYIHIFIHVFAAILNGKQMPGDFFNPFTVCS